MAARIIIALILVAVVGGGVAVWQLGLLAPWLEQGDAGGVASNAPTESEEEEEDLTAPVPRPTRVCPAIAEGIDRKALKAHLEAFEEIAREHDGNRAAISDGYDASVDYVVEHMKEAGLEVTRSKFNVPEFEVLGQGALEVLAPKARVFRAARKHRQPANTPGAAYTVLRNTPPGHVRGALVAVDLALGPGNKTTSGCEKEDFGSAVRGNVVLIQRGKCPFATKAKNAQQAGATAAIIFNQGNTLKRRGLIPGQLIGDPSDQDITIPVLFATTSTGETLATMIDEGPVEVRVHAQTRWRLQPEINVLTELPGLGDKADEVVMLGAHLDSVEEGPGINDNASGSAALLAIAAQLTDCRSARTIRIAWWGAEELGLLGSTAYVDDLDDEAKKNIRAYINLDMIGSINHVYQLADGDGSKHKKAGPGTSGELEVFFAKDFVDHKLVTWESRFLFRSDYRAFHSAGIGVAQLNTGHSVKKKPRQAVRFGGTANAPLDPCYHKACDDLTNVNMEVVEIITRSMARAVQHFGIDGKGLN